MGTTLYGTAHSGGPKDAGILFSLGTNGTHFTVLRRFQGTDGEGPSSALRAGANGVAYGVTEYGGAGYPGYTYGVLFELKPDGTYTILHAFTGGADGGQPNNIILAPSGVIFGSTSAGGIDCTGYNANGCGVVFEYDPAMGKFTVLYTASVTQGYEPLLGSLGADGTLYAANRYGDAGGGEGTYGTLFSLETTGSKTYNVLADFNGLNGAYPSSGPLLNADGSLTGTTKGGSTGSNGTIYHFAAGALTTAYSFGDHPGQGVNPESQPLPGGSGELTGTAAYGGPPNPQTTFGTIYRVSP